MPTVRAGPWQGCCCVCGRIATAGGRRALRLPVAGVSTEAHARRFQYYPDSRKDRGTHLCAFGVSARGQSPSAARAGTGVDVGAVVVAGVGSGAVHLVCAGSGRGGGAVGSFARVRLGMSGSVVVGWSGRAVCRAGDLDIQAAGRTCVRGCMRERLFGFVYSSGAGSAYSGIRIFSDCHQSLQLDWQRRSSPPAISQCRTLRCANRRRPARRRAPAGYA